MVSRWVWVIPKVKANHDVSCQVWAAMKFVCHRAGMSKENVCQASKHPFLWLSLPTKGNSEKFQLSVEINLNFNRLSTTISIVEMQLFPDRNNSDLDQDGARSVWTAWGWTLLDSLAAFWRIREVKGRCCLEHWEGSSFFQQPFMYKMISTVHLYKVMSCHLISNICTISICKKQS